MKRYIENIYSGVVFPMLHDVAPPLSVRVCLGGGVKWVWSVPSCAQVAGAVKGGGRRGRSSVTAGDLRDARIGWGL